MKNSLIKARADRLLRTVRWVSDKISGEMIQKRGYKTTHLTFNQHVEETELHAICEAINSSVLSRSGFRIGHHSGEIMMGTTGS